MKSALFLLLASTFRVSTPLIFAALGGLLSERAGVINIALEGMMLVGAVTAAAVALVAHSPWVGALAGALAGVLLAATYATAVISLRSDQIVAGTAINLLAAGIAPFICKILYGVTGSSPALPIASRFQSAPMGVAWVCVVVIAYILRETPFGLWVRFAGEHPEALDSAGVSVNRMRCTCVLLGGALAGLGGATLSTFLASSFSRNMTAGRGFMALAALIFGKWKPVPAALACLLFGFADALQIELQGVVLWGSDPVPVQFIQIIPYLVTILALAGFVGHSRAPRAIGLPFRKG